MKIKNVIAKEYALRSFYYFKYIHICVYSYIYKMCMGAVTVSIQLSIRLFFTRPCILYGKLKTHVMIYNAVFCAFQ